MDIDALPVEMAIRRLVTKCRSNAKFSESPVTVLINAADQIIDEAKAPTQLIKTKQIQELTASRTKQ